MPKDTVADPTDPGTRRPKENPLKTKGDHFTPMKLPKFDTEIHLPNHVSADSPITLFAMYCPLGIIEYIVEMTYLNIRETRDLSRPNARAKDWQPTSPGESILILQFAFT
jgi:hypothetical protein